MPQPQTQVDSAAVREAAHAAAQARADSIRHVSDSLHLADSVAAAHAPSFAPVPWARCSEAMAPSSPSDRTLYATRPPGWMNGVDAPARIETPADNVGVTAMLLALFVVLGFNMGNVRRLFKSLPQKLFSVRRRDNAFDEPTSNETRTFCILVFLMCFFEGVLTYIWLGNGRGAAATMEVAALTGLFAAYYIFDFCAVSVVGWTFSDKRGTQSLRRGLNSSCAILGVALAVPGLLALFYPDSALFMLYVAAAMYILLRIAFIIKGFRIFYVNFPSLLYFILYLCALEIIPVIVLYVAAQALCSAL